MKVVSILNIPAPYREKVHENISEKQGANYEVIYCAEIERNRSWHIPEGKYEKSFLQIRTLDFGARTIYLTSNIWSKLNSYSPDVLVIGGFGMPMLIAYCWAIINRKKLIAFSDATIHSERSLSFVHKLLRRFFLPFCSAYVGASKKTLSLFSKYGASEHSLFQSHLCIENSRFSMHKKKLAERAFDILLCGQMIERKMYDFSIDVIESLRNHFPKLRVKLMGDGPQKKKILCRLKKLEIDFDFLGFVQQAELPQQYADCKIFLFPSKCDPWGVVANESCAAGTPVITCEEVGAAGELIVNGKNGYVLPLDVDCWVNTISELLRNEVAWSSLSAGALEQVAEYNYENATKGLIAAIES